MNPTGILAAAATGLLLGPLVRAVAWRHSAPTAPRTACPACGHTARIAASRPYTGRCPHCRQHTAPAPLLPEALTATGFALAASTGGPPLQTLALCWLAAFATALALIDAAVHRLPDRLTAPAFLGTALLLTGAALQRSEPGTLLRLYLAAGVLGAGYLALALIAPVGLGDVKLAPTLGAALGYFSWSALARGTFAAFLLAGLYAAARLITHRPRHTHDLPFGPFMILGAFAAILTATP